MEKAIKQRLLGGLVLVAGAALFLPVLLDGSGAPLTMPPMPIPPKVPVLEAVAPRLDAQVKAADAAVVAAHEGQTFTDRAAVVEGDVVADAAANVEAVATSPGAAAIAAAAQATASAAADAKRALAEKTEKAKAEQQKLEQQKLEQLSAQKTADKAQAALAKTSAKAVVPVTVATAKSAALPEAWVVQVASLTSQDKADALVQSLRKKSYHAVAHKQGDVWKVVIGPELRREIADSIKSRLAADPELKLSGWVQAYKP